MTKILQISDPHIAPRGQLVYEKVDTAKALQETVETINRLDGHIGPIDLVIVTGDLTEHGLAEEYQHFRQIMASLKTPWRAVPGNHDQRETMRAAFADHHWMSDEGPIDWRYDGSDFCVLGLDTLVEGAAHGQMQPASELFLKTQLREQGGKPALIGFHHPPFDSGLATMDRQRLNDPSPLAAAIRGYDGEIRLICGHLHRAIAGLFEGRLCHVCPGTSHAVTLDQREDAENSLTMEPGGFLLHELRGASFLSHWLPVGRFSGPWPFLGV